MFILAELASAAGVQLLPTPDAIVRPVFILHSCQIGSQAAGEMLRPRWDSGAGEAAPITTCILVFIPACILACMHPCLTAFLHPCFHPFLYSCLSASLLLTCIPAYIPIYLYHCLHPCLYPCLCSSLHDCSLASLPASLPSCIPACISVFWVSWEWVALKSLSWGATISLVPAINASCGGIPSFCHQVGSDLRMQKAY